MSTSSPALTFDSLSPEDIAILETPQDPTPQFDRPFARALYAAGLEKKAARAERCQKYFRWHTDAAGHKFSVSSCRCGIGGCERCAQYKAILEYRKYRALSMYVHDSLTYLEIRREAGKAARSILKHLGPILSKVGWKDGRWVEKVLLCFPAAAIPTAVVHALRLLDTHLLLESYLESHFPDVLRGTLSPDLPPTTEMRVAMERSRWRRLTFQGMRREERRKLHAIDPKPIACNLEPEFSPEPAPRCPRCGQPAIRRSQWLSKDVPEAELQWESLVFAPPPE